MNKNIEKNEDKSLEELLRKVPYNKGESVDRVFNASTQELHKRVGEIIDELEEIGNLEYKVEENLIEICFTFYGLKRKFPKGKLKESRRKDTRKRIDSLPNFIKKAKAFAEFEEKLGTIARKGNDINTSATTVDYRTLYEEYSFNINGISYELSNKDENEISFDEWLRFRNSNKEITYNEDEDRFRFDMWRRYGISNIEDMDNKDRWYKLGIYYTIDENNGFKFVNRKDLKDNKKNLHLLIVGLFDTLDKVIRELDKIVSNNEVEYKIKMQ